MKKSTVFTVTVGAVVATATLLPSFGSGVVAMDVLVRHVLFLFLFVFLIVLVSFELKVLTFTLLVLPLLSLSLSLSLKYHQDESSSSSSVSPPLRSTSHRILHPNEACTLTLREVQLLNVDGEEDAVSDQSSWTCELASFDRVASGQEFVDVKGLDDDFFIRNNVTSGETTMMSASSYIMGSDIIVPEDTATSDIMLGHEPKKRPRNKKLSKKSKESERSSDHHRQLEQDVRTVLVVRIKSLTDGSETTPTVLELQDDVFEDSVCLASQYAACSYGKLQFVPASYGNLVTNGVITIKINSDIDGVSTSIVQSNVVDELDALFGESVSNLFHHIMLCLPGGTVSGTSTSW
jgi:hypothetical protein